MTLPHVRWWGVESSKILRLLYRTRATVARELHSFPPSSVCWECYSKSFCVTDGRSNWVMTHSASISTITNTNVVPDSVGKIGNQDEIQEAVILFTAIRNTAQGQMETKVARTTKSCEQEAGMASRSRSADNQLAPKDSARECSFMK